MQCRHILDAMRCIPRGLRNTLRTLRLILDNALQRRGAALLDEESQAGDNHTTILSHTHINPIDSTLQGANDHNPIPSQERSVHSPPSGSSASQSPSSDADPAFLIVGLVCLAVINVIFLVDIELTLSRNKQIQSREADEWGFGQVLALLLLVVPLRDFAKSILDIRRKSCEKEEHANREFEKHLRDAIQDGTFEGHDFQSWIEQGANPDTQIEGICFYYAVTKTCIDQFITDGVTLLQFATHQRKNAMVQYLLAKKADPNVQGECWYTSQPTMTQTGNQGRGMEQRCRSPRRVETLK